MSVPTLAADGRGKWEPTLQAGKVLSRLGGVVSEELGELETVGGVLVDTELDVLAERFVELVEVLLVLGDLAEHLHGLLDQVLSDDFEDLVLLEGLTGDVEGEVLRVDDTLDEVEVLGDELLAVVHDEDTSDVELDVVALLLGFEEIERSSARVNSSVKEHNGRDRRRDRSTYRLGTKRIALNSS